jgi:peptidoglycan-associated lipoprotein
LYIKPFIKETEIERVAHRNCHFYTISLLNKIIMKVLEVFPMVRNVKAMLPVLLCVSILTLSGCGSKSKTDQAMKEEVKSEAMGVEEPLESKPLGISEGRTTEGMLPVYFDFDSSVIRKDQVARVEVNAEFIKNQKDYDIKIEGNCDPRGTNEYNMALGERRALSAKKYLVNLGIDEARLSTISYGEERLLLQGQDELSWAQNRRDDFVVVE